MLGYTTPHHHDVLLLLLLLYYIYYYYFVCIIRIIHTYGNTHARRNASRNTIVKKLTQKRHRADRPNYQRVSASSRLRTPASHPSRCPQLTVALTERHFHAETKYPAKNSQSCIQADLHVRLHPQGHRIGARKASSNARKWQVVGTLGAAAALAAFGGRLRCWRRKEAYDVSTYCPKTCNPGK